MTIALKRGSVITGELRDQETGKTLRVPYLYINYQPEGGTSNYTHARTKRDGSFRIVVPAGKGRLYSSDSMASAVPRDASGKKADPPSILIDIKPGETQTGKNLLFLRGGVIEGQVLDP